MKNNVFTAYTSAVKKITARPDPFADTETAPEPTKITETRKPEKHWGFAAYACAMLAVVCLVTAGVFGFLRSVTKDAPSSSGIEADDVPDPPFPVYRDNLQMIRPNTGIVDVMYSSPQQTVDHAQIIAVGEYLDDPTRDRFDRSEWITGTYTVNDIKLLNVLKGDFTEGDILEVYQNYQIKNVEQNGKMCTVLNIGYNGLVPMYKGDQAIFLISYNEGMKAYQVTDRFPLPENKNKEDRLGFKNGIADTVTSNNDFGYNVSFNQTLYNYILKTYDLGTDPAPDLSIDPLNINYFGSIPNDIPKLTPEEAVGQADIIFIGEYMDNLEKTDADVYGADKATATVNNIKVLKPLKGKINVNNIIPTTHNYLFVLSEEENKRDILYYNTCFMPMFKGDKAIFLMKANNKGYELIELYGRLPYFISRGSPSAVRYLTDSLGFENSLAPAVSEEDRNAVYSLYSYLSQNYDLSL